MKVLFVDDEARVLEALERALRIAGVGWEMRFVTSGQAALAELEVARYDVIVSDMRMPGMDGAALLSAAFERDPAMARVVLSGQAEEAAALRVVRVAHQFMSKPCDAKILRQVVERSGMLHSTLADPSLRAMLGGVDRLPSSLHVFQQLSELLARDEVSADAVAAVVRQDPAMASKLLQFANSAFFARSRDIPDIRTAVILLGTKTIKNLALGFGVFATIGTQKGGGILSVEDLQRRAFSTAKIASAAMPERELTDAAFMAGLVCDVGELVLASKAPERLRAAWEAAAERGVARVVGEREIFGVSHVEVGAYLLNLWGLPFRVIEAVAHHHSPQPGAQSGRDLPLAVWLASTLAAGEEPSPEQIQAYGAQSLFERARAAIPPAP
ncbi:MAG: HDOD domain-containing protein [Myxococcales bacterium]